LSQVRTHTRQQGGKTVTVRRHDRDPEAAAATAQRKRDTFERRVLKERQQAANPGAYTTTTTTRTAGERRRKRGPQPARAKRRAKKALRLWRRHKVRAVFHFAVAAGEVGVWAAWRAGANTRNAARKLRQRRKDRR
jgi:hypothetical protein